MLSRISEELSVRACEAERDAEGDQVLSTFFFKKEMFCFASTRCDVGVSFGRRSNMQWKSGVTCFRRNVNHSYSSTSLTKTKYHSSKHETPINIW